LDYLESEFTRTTYERYDAYHLLLQKKAKHTKGFSSFGSSAIFYKTRRFPSRPLGRFGFVGISLY
jgi:hypothetical protein